MTDRDAIALTLYGEARSEGIEGMIAVACVLRNRLLVPHRYGGTYEEVCHKPYAFSCWNEHDPNRQRLLAIERMSDRQRIEVGPQLVQCYVLADVLLNRMPYLDFATHYHAVGSFPKWAEAGHQVAHIGHHIFYADVDGPMPVTV